MKRNIRGFEEFVNEEKKPKIDEVTKIEEIKEDNTEESKEESKGIDNLKDDTFNFLLKVLGYRNQLRVNHWQTEIFSEHKMTDDLMEVIDEKVDAIGESTLGIFGRPKIQKQDTEVTDIKDISTKEIIENIHKGLCELVEQYKETEHEGIISLLGDFCAEIEKFKYLSTFSE